MVISLFIITTKNIKILLLYYFNNVWMTDFRRVRVSSSKAIILIITLFRAFTKN